MKSSPIFLLLLFVLAGNAQAQSEASRAFRIADSINQKSPGNEVAILHKMQQIKPAEDDAMGQGIWPQSIMGYHSFVGNYDSALYYRQYMMRSYTNDEPNKINPQFLNGKEVKPLREVLPELIVNKQVVMMNEAHYNPATRTTLINGLEEFKKQGFKALAVEGLYNYEDAERLNQQGYPVVESGYYTREPLFGELIRQACKKGFTLINYESQVECDNYEHPDNNHCNSFRDSIQAVNLAKWVKQNPGEKLLVWAGHDHILEKNKGSWKHLAQYFQEMTGIDPLTIEQTNRVEYFFTDFEPSDYKTVAEQITEPSVLFNSENGYYGDLSGADVQVFMPRYRVEGKRPQFYSLNGERKATKVNNIKPPFTYVQAFYANETGHRVAADRINFNRYNTLYLYPGKYNIEYVSDKGETIYTKTIVVR